MVKSIEVTKNSNESNANLLRRFSRRARNSGLLRKVRSLRYYQRNQSEAKKKESALNRLHKLEEIERDKKLGKIK